MIARVIDGFVMLAGAFILGWFLVPQNETAGEEKPSSVIASQPATEEPEPVATAACPEPLPPAPVTAARPAARPPAAHQLPEVYLEVIGPIPGM